MFSKTYLVTIVVALTIWASACGVATESGASDLAGSETGAAQVSSPEFGQATATVTLSTGDVFELDVRQCDTQVTAPTAPLTAEFFDVVGTTSDGMYRFTAQHRNGHDTPDRYGPQLVFKGLFDENGNNAEIEYTNLSTPRHTPPSVAVDGTRVTGEGILLGAESNEWGGAIDVVFDFRCG